MNFNKLKSFYKSNLFNGYTDSMPDWLKKCSSEDFLALRNLLAHRIFKQKQKMLDIGCGNMRVFDKLWVLGNKHTLHAADIFKYNELPEPFKEKLKEFDIKYLAMPDGKIPWQWNKYYRTYDIITCYGVDIHLDNRQVQNYLAECYKMLKPGGFLVWQANRKDTFKGILLRLKDWKLHYQYRPDKFYRYLNCFPDHIYKTSTSRFFIWIKKDLKLPQNYLPNS